MKQAVAYCRVSTIGQIEKGGFDRQRAAISRFAKGARIEIVKFYEDAVSGAAGESDRPKFDEMLADLLADGVRTIIVEGLDRLAREYRIQEHLLVYLCAKGLSLISANTGEDITAAIQADPMKKALVQIQGVFSELDRNLILNRLKKGRDKKRTAAGKCEGPARYGQCGKNCSGLKHSERCASERAVLDEIARLRMRPRPLSFGKIAFHLNQKGLRTRMDRPWSTMTVFNAFERKG